MGSRLIGSARAGVTAAAANYIIISQSYENIYISTIRNNAQYEIYFSTPPRTRFRAWLL